MFKPGDDNDSKMHPLISYNSSTLKECSFSSLLSDYGFYALDHQVNGQKIFPGAGFMEIACIAGNIAGEQPVRKIKDIVWAQPLSFQKGPKMVQTFLKSIGGGTEYEIISLNEEYERVVHSEGRLFFSNDIHQSVDMGKSFSIRKLKEQCSAPREGAHYYEQFRKSGFNYGPAFQTIQEFYINGVYALSKLKVAASLKTDFDKYILHPSIIDGALQTVVGLMDETRPADVPYLPFALDEVDIIRSLPTTCYAYAEFSGSDEHTKAGIRKFDILILSEAGNVVVKLNGFYVRPMNAAQGIRAGEIDSHASTDISLTHTQ